MTCGWIEEFTAPDGSFPNPEKWERIDGNAVITGNKFVARNQLRLLFRSVGNYRLRERFHSGADFGIAMDVSHDPETSGPFLAVAARLQFKVSPWVAYQAALIDGELWGLAGATGVRASSASIGMWYEHSLGMLRTGYKLPGGRWVQTGSLSVPAFQDAQIGFGLGETRYTSRAFPSVTDVDIVAHPELIWTLTQVSLRHQRMTFPVISGGTLSAVTEDWHYSHDVALEWVDLRMMLREESYVWFSRSLAVGQSIGLRFFYDPVAGVARLFFLLPGGGVTEYFTRTDVWSEDSPRVSLNSSIVMFTSVDIAIDNFRHEPMTEAIPEPMTEAIPLIKGVAPVFDGIIDSVGVDRGKGTLKIYNHMIFWQRRIPRRDHTATCPWTYKDADTCRYVGALPPCDKSWEHCTERANTLNFGGFRWLPALQDKQIWWGRVPGGAPAPPPPPVWYHEPYDPGTWGSGNGGGNGGGP